MLHTGIERLDCILPRNWRTTVYKSHARARRYQAFFFLDEPTKFWYSGLAFFNLAHTLTDITYFIPRHCGPCIKWSILRISPSVNHAEEFDHRRKVAERSRIIRIIRYLSCIIIRIKYSNFGRLSVQDASEIVIHTIEKRMITRTKISRKCRIKFVPCEISFSRKLVLKLTWNWLKNNVFIFF